MSDTTQTLQLPGARLESIDRDGDDSITLHFSKVFLVQDMEGAIEDSLWTQAVSLTIRDIELDGELPDCPCEISGGDLTNNIYTYRDHAPLPIDWRGEVYCKLAIDGKAGKVTISGESMQLEQLDHPRYIKHTRK
ncbi:MAG: hypothetical protein OEU91_03845 [Gammaproteobacteria bacterium]|nr:hypothetical protein [Gammaproteobacteria bacterium]